MNNVSFARIVFHSLYQSGVIFLGSMFLFSDMFVLLVTVSYSALVFTEILNIFLLVGRPNKWIYTTCAISFFFFIISALFLRGMLGIMPITLDMLWKILVLTLVCWGPFEVMKWIRKTFAPTLSDKIMKIAKDDGELGGEQLDVMSSEGKNELL